MICKHCKKEIEETRQFGNLICKPIEQFNVTFENIIIPEGWNIPTLQEGIDLVNNGEFIEWSKFSDTQHDFYIKQPFMVNKDKVAWFGCYLDGFGLDGSYDLYVADAARGVLLVKKVRRTN
mgnify:CR=1 FL=1